MQRGAQLRTEMVWTYRAEDIKKRWQEYTELYKKDFHDPDNHGGVITPRARHPGM